MLRFLAFSALVALSAANICTDETGTWSFEIGSGVVDFAYTGVPLNKKFFCFQGCLVTGTAVQNYKVSLYNTSVEAISYERSPAEIRNQLRADDPNADSCIDPVLRADVAAAISKATSATAKAITTALFYNLNRRNWAIVTVGYGDDGFAMNSIYQDVYFCDYDAVVNGELFNIKVAKIDMS